MYFVYILTNKRHTVLYVGVTYDLIRRVYEHKGKLIDGFTKKYNIDQLVYFESTEDPSVAIAREKQLKHWRREWKLKLIRANNPSFLDLSSTF